MIIYLQALNSLVRKAVLFSSSGDFNLPEINGTEFDFEQSTSLKCRNLYNFIFFMI